MLTVLQTALEVGLIYGLVALALFISFSILNIADLSTDGCFTLGCAVGAMLTIAGHPILALFAAMAAGMLSGYVTAFCRRASASRASSPASSRTPASTRSTSRSWAFRPTCPSPGLTRCFRSSRALSAGSGAG